MQKCYCVARRWRAEVFELRRPKIPVSTRASYEDLLCHVSPFFMAAHKYRSKIQKPVETRNRSPRYIAVASSTPDGRPDTAVAHAMNGPKTTTTTKKSRSNYPDRIISGIGYYYHCSDSCCCRCLVFYSNIIFRGWSFRRLALSGHSFFLSTADDDQPLNDKGHTFRFCPLRGAYDDDDGRQGRRNQEIRAKEIYM